MLRHIRKKHSTTYEYWICPEARCSTKLIRRAYMFRHLINTHKIDECTARMKAINSIRGDQYQEDSYYSEENYSKEDNCNDLIIANDSISSGIEDNQEENDVIIIISDEEENNKTRMEHFIGTTRPQTLILTFKRTINIVNGQEHVRDKDFLCDYFEETI
ncbi:unnamed protein product [Mytilus coruscus]|uniref:Uncharacterized protein n=1 Tax=Mytilus coruscus TaxID=42192 RepID=A0A6J8BM98_MYTCO|nr:unnamed protein product [Mytilus coruscus]